MPFWTPSQQCQNRLYRIVSVVRFFDCVNYVTMPVVSVGLRLVLQLTWLTFALSWVALVNICKWFGCRFGICRYIWKPCDHTQYVTKLLLGISLSAMSLLVETVCGLRCFDTVKFNVRSPSSASTLLIGWQEGHRVCKKLRVGLVVVIIWL